VRRETKWTDDGHVLVVIADGPHPEEGDVGVSIECPPEGCKGPFIACEQCSGSGYEMDADGDETACSACDESGYDKGVHQCWFAAGHEDWRDALHDEHDDWWRPGRYRLSYSSEGYYEDFHTALRRGEPVAAADGERTR
jgi:hypothetical protein